MNSEREIEFVPPNCCKGNQTHCLNEQDNHVAARRIAVFDCTSKEVVGGFHLAECPKGQRVASQEICLRELVHHTWAVKNKEVMTLSCRHWKGVTKTVLGSMARRD